MYGSAFPFRLAVWKSLSIPPAAFQLSTRLHRKGCAQLLWYSMQRDTLRQGNPCQMQAIPACSAANQVARSLSVQEDGRSQPSFSSLLSRSWHHRSAVEYEEDALQPCEAYERLLREWVPFLKKEINRCTDFLMLREKGLLSSPQALPASPCESSCTSSTSWMICRPRLRKFATDMPCTIYWLLC